MTQACNLDYSCAYNLYASIKPRYAKRSDNLKGKLMSDQPKKYLTTYRRFQDATGFFKLDSRLNRVKFLALNPLWSALLLIVAFPIALITQNMMTTPPWYVTTILAVIFIICVINSFLTSIRRLHDCNLPWYWLFLLFIPYAHTIFFILLALSPGSQGVNRYGEPPSKANIYYRLLAILGGLITCAIFIFSLPLLMHPKK